MEAPVYQYSLLDKARMCFAGVRQLIRPGRKLIAGPYVGEFGWELMQWQGYVRARRRHYEQVHVISYPGRDYLYEGCRVHYHDIPLHSAGHRYGTLTLRQSCEMAEAKARELGWESYDVFSPHLLCTQYHKRLIGRQEFRLFEEPPLPGVLRDVAFHFRRVEKPGEHPKNYTHDLAATLVEECVRQDISVICIGHPDYAFCPDGAEDRRTVGLQETVRAISSVRLVAGANSGPMHLANLCGKPTALWAHSQDSIDYSLRWNPFRVPIFIVANDTHLPSPGRVCAQVIGALADLREWTSDFRERNFHLPAQQIAYY